MIYKGAVLKVIDNSGARSVLCINVLVGSNASVGDIINVAVKDSIPGARVAKGSVGRAVIVRLKKEYQRPSGVFIRFDDNAVVMLNPQNEMIGSRVNGIVDDFLKKKGFNKVVSLSRRSD